MTEGSSDAVEHASTTQTEPHMFAFIFAVYPIAMAASVVVLTIIQSV